MDNKGNGNILVTGFGPFGEHYINASWEAVKMLPHQIDGFNIVKKEIPVNYNSVEEEVPKLWKIFKPVLVVHVGVSSIAKEITVEQRAHRKGYKKCDVSGKIHPTGEISCAGEECLITGIDIDQICRNLNQKECVNACTSTDAGRYLCEYVYYISLTIDLNKTLFVHVPPLNETSSEEVASSLQEIIISALEQIASNSSQLNSVTICRC